MRKSREYWKESSGRDEWTRDVMASETDQRNGVAHIATRAIVRTLVQRQNICVSEGVE